MIIVKLYSIHVGGSPKGILISVDVHILGNSCHAHYIHIVNNVVFSDSVKHKFSCLNLRPSQLFDICYTLSSTPGPSTELFNVSYTVTESV